MKQYLSGTSKSIHLIYHNLNPHQLYQATRYNGQARRGNNATKKKKEENKELTPQDIRSNSSINLLPHPLHLRNINTIKCSPLLNAIMDNNYFRTSEPTSKTRDGG
jgi:hypothetical protein